MEKDTTFVVILEWMLDLNLSIVERTIYAVIYGFSQRNMGKFTGSRAYLARWCSCTTRTVDTALSKLLSVGLIVKEEKFEGGVKLCSYTANLPQRKNFAGCEKISQGVAQNFPYPSEKISHNNIEDNIDNNIDDTTRTRVVADAPKPKKNTKFSFRDTLIAAGISADHTDTILNIRQDKRLTQSENACANLIKAITAICNQRGVTADEVAAFMVAQKWGAIRPDWQGVERIKANVRRRMVTMSVGDILNRELAI